MASTIEEPERLLVRTHLIRVLETSTRHCNVGSIHGLTGKLMPSTQMWEGKTFPKKLKRTVSNGTRELEEWSNL